MVVVVCLSVCPCVTVVLWLSFRSSNKLFAPIISHACGTWACKISAIQCKANIFKLGVEWRGKKNVRFRRKTGYISETVRDTAKVTINH